MSRTSKVLGLVAVVALSATVMMGCGDSGSSGSGLTNGAREAWLYCETETWMGQTYEHCAGYSLRSNKTVVDVWKDEDDGKWYGCVESGITWGTRGDELIMYDEGTPIDIVNYNLSGNTLTLWYDDDDDDIIELKRTNVGSLNMVDCDYDDWYHGPKMEKVAKSGKFMPKKK